MNRLVRPIMFAFEPDVVKVFSRLTFGASGAVTLDTKNSKGICNAAIQTVSLTATTDGSTAVLTAPSSLVGLYVGMDITGAGIPAGSTITAITAATPSITISQNTTGAHVTEAMVAGAAGGVYTITFGSQFSPFKRLDTYNKLSQVTHLWCEEGVPGSASVQALVPNAPQMILINNSIGVSSSASITVAFGASVVTAASGATAPSSAFTVLVPSSGEIVRLAVDLVRSSAI